LQLFFSVHLKACQLAGEVVSQHLAIAAVALVGAGGYFCAVGGEEDDSYAQKAGKMVEDTLGILLENKIYLISHDVIIYKICIKVHRFCD
jgi:hypothetical protein